MGIIMDNSEFKLRKRKISEVNLKKPDVFRILMAVVYANSMYYEISLDPFVEFHQLNEIYGHQYLMRFNRLEEINSQLLFFDKEKNLLLWIDGQAQTAYADLDLYNNLMNKFKIKGDFIEQ